MATRALPRALRASTSILSVSRPTILPSRVIQRAAFHISATRLQKKKKNATAPSPEAGAFARTDDSITVEYPEDSSQLPSSQPVDSGIGRAGQNVFPTLATFSLQGK
ncbi:hypothetical protein N0V85_003940, partial [Neurospora sp. IMI 360204]